MSHTPEEVATFLSGGRPTHQLKLAESRDERRIRLILDLLIDMKASLSVVERDSFKPLWTSSESTSPLRTRHCSHGSRNVQMKCAGLASPNETPSFRLALP